jgi:NADH-quinone oxidoreductase subunit A
VSGLLRAYLTVAVFGGAAVMMVAGMLGAGRLLRPSPRPTEGKLLTYESGVDPVGSRFIQSQIRYYVFALLFVMFDVEAVFVFPWAIGLEGMGGYGFWAMMLFIAVLTLPLVYAWRKGVLRWV